MRSSPSHRFLHIANGTCTTDTIHAAGIPGTSSIWADVLHEGPVPGGVSDRDLVEVRARHLADPSDPANDYESTVAGLNRWRTVIDDHDSYDELLLWFEHDLFDQLNLIHVLSVVAGKRPTPTPVSLICIGSFPGRPQFKGLGELTSGELASLLDTRHVVTDAQYDVADRAWQAFRASNPREIETLLTTDTSALPFLSAALRRHLEEFPWTTDGLSRSERRLMTLVRGGPVETWTVFPRMHDLETAFYIADGSLWQVVQGLAAPPAPLVTVQTTSSTTERLPRATIALTALGREVLDGEADRIDRCGFDRWLGGVHVRGVDNLWRWDPLRARIVEAEY